MFDIGWSEMAVIAVVALMVIGPKDLPRALHTVGKWVRKARMLAREFQGSVDEMVRQAELEDLKKQVEQARNFNVSAEIEKTVDPDGGLRQAMVIEDRLEDVEIARPAPAAPKAEPATALPTAVAAPMASVEAKPDAAPVPLEKQG